MGNLDTYGIDYICQYLSRKDMLKLCLTGIAERINIHIFTQKFSKSVRF